jgi:glycosyltransferase involved in cell wall biosynthesis
MDAGAPRAAFFADSFHEVNGVALTSRRIHSYAVARGLPFFSCHTGPKTQVQSAGGVTTCEIALSPLSFGLEKDLRFDLLFLRHRRFVESALRQFKPQVVHITGPSHTGMLGAIAAAVFGVPLVASWHTNVHEYAGRRLEQVLGLLPRGLAHRAGLWAEHRALSATLLFYRRARVLLAPNAELCRMLEEGTGRECHLMPRGVDADLYHPSRRDRTDDSFEVGYVGRLSPEKNVRLLARIGQVLEAADAGPFRITMVGHGGEQEWLQQNVPNGHFPGVLRGEALARAYANFDLFAFPSRTDTYGNVIQEAMAAGVPCVVTDGGGPKFLVEHGKEGWVASSDDEFVQAVVQCARDRAQLRTMSAAARTRALQASWDRVGELVWQAYARAAA